MVYTSAERRKWLAWHQANGSNVASTSRKFGVGRSTLYRWLKRYDPTNPGKPLRSLSRRPLNKRQRTWTDHHIKALARLCYEYPRWGGTRLHRAVVARGWQVSPATVGRMLRETRLRCPICQATGTEQHREILHLQERDMRNMGFDFPSGNSPGNPTSLKSIRETEEALGEVEDILRGGG